MENVKLIDGKFHPLNAKEIVLAMINNKIQFHTSKNFSAEIRTGTPEFQSQKRIVELREVRRKIITLLEKAEKENLLVELHATLDISCIENEQEEKNKI